MPNLGDVDNEEEAENGAEDGEKGKMTSPDEVLAGEYVRCADAQGRPPPLMVLLGSNAQVG